MKVLNKDGLESVLLQNWSKFSDTTKLMAFVLQQVRDHEWIVAKEETPQGSTRSISLSLSRCSWVEHGFEVWVEFTVPIDKGIAIGTVEAIIRDGGEVHPLDITGVLFK